MKRASARLMPPHFFQLVGQRKGVDVGFAHEVFLVAHVADHHGVVSQHVSHFSGRNSNQFRVVGRTVIWIEVTRSG